jgi:hypothetical protein
MDIYTNIYVGNPKHTLPSVEYTGFPGGIIIKQQESLMNSFTFYGGLGLNYRYNKSVAFNLAANYFYSKPEFINIVTAYSNGFTSRDEYTQKITTINVEAGVSFIIGR